MQPTPVFRGAQNLSRLFYDFAKLTAWATPPLSPEQLSDDSAPASLPRKFTMPFQAADLFASSLGLSALALPQPTQARRSTQFERLRLPASVGSHHSLSKERQCHTRRGVLASLARVLDSMVLTRLG
jgi:hypothetical protein